MRFVANVVEIAAEYFQAIWTLEPDDPDAQPSLCHARFFNSRAEALRWIDAQAAGRTISWEV
ncbi:hypothetical protein [Roseomonas sp. BN140053]|uniref:hypothetical protein n=1 Tax=Roseomonas sp. BN140053 TaxID=3391898 RepID=UPI0039EBE17A